MLLQFSIKNFRSIKEKIILDFRTTGYSEHSDAKFKINSTTQLLKTIGIYGPNASGKSSIIRGLNLFQKIVLESYNNSLSEPYLKYTPYYLSKESINAPTEFAMDFVLGKKMYRYKFSYLASQIVEEELFSLKVRDEAEIPLFKRKKSIIRLFGINKEFSFLTSKTKRNVLFLSVLALNNNQLANDITEFLREDINTFHGTNNDTSEYTLKKMRQDPEWKEKMIDLIQQADLLIEDFVIEEVTLSEKEKLSLPEPWRSLANSEEGSRVVSKIIRTQYSMDDNPKTEKVILDFREESKGTQEWFWLVSPIIDSLEKGKVLIIDELTASLHPKVARYLISLFNSDRNLNNAQLVFVTHDLTSLDTDLLRPDQVYFTEKGKIGGTELFSLASFKSIRASEPNIEKKYLEGRFGAVPYLEDYDNIMFNKR